jgi:adenosine kinase
MQANATTQDDSKIDVLFFCNPLLDISIDDEDASVLGKYKLQAGHAVLASDEQMPLFDEAYKREGRLLIPGGSALNSARACGWTFQKAGSGVAGYMGAIGKDERGATLTDAVKASNVQGYFQHVDGTETGACAVVIHGKERALCAYLGAAVKFSTDFLEENMEKVNLAQSIYATGFFITSNAAALRKVADHCAEHNKVFGFNLSAAFVVQFYADDVKYAIEHADIVFGNEDECDAFGKSVGIEGGSR